MLRVYQVETAEDWAYIRELWTLLACPDSLLLLYWGSGIR